MLKFKPFQGPQRFVFIDPDTGHEYIADNKRNLYMQIINYRSQNNLSPIMALSEVLDNYLCSLPENTGKCVSKKLGRGWVQTIRGGIALLENIFYGDDAMVSQEEADKRASICALCPKNVFPDKGAFVAWADEIALNSTGGKTTIHDDKLGNCSVCTCPLRAKVHYKGKFELSRKERSELPDFCWMIGHEKIIS